MRTYLKSEIIDLCQSMQGLHYEISILENTDEKHEFLEICASAIASVENSMNIYDKKYTNMLKDLFIYSDVSIDEVKNSSNRYKEILEVVSIYKQGVEILLNQETITTEELEVINDLAYELEQRINEVSITYRILFMPCSVSSWDSLESIWNTAKADPDCECVLVPLPYEKIDEGEWEPVYEGYKFPEEISIVHYSNFELEEYSPDVIYIHNANDDCNDTTRAYPEYFASELKKYSNKVVFVPDFFSTSSLINAENVDLPSYESIDYIISRSEENKQQFTKKPFYDKIIALGSPKVDHLIDLQYDYIDIPEDWEDIVEDKKTILLGTTINSILKHKDLVVSKLKYIFELAQQNEEVALIWRPHPLLDSTLSSKLPELYEEYEKLVEYFLDEEIGVLDKTPDMSRSIALCDACIACEDSCLESLFSITNKPMYTLNYEVTPNTNISEDEEVAKAEELANTPLQKTETSNVLTRLETSEITPSIFMKEVANDEFDFISDQIRDFNEENGLDLDGNAGEQIHEFVMNVLKEETKKLEEEMKNNQN